MKNVYLRLSIILATVSAGALLYFFIDARVSNFFPHCPFNSLTGLFCPGCGSQRAISALLHGDVLDALNLNLLLVLSLPLLVYSAGVHVYNAFGKRHVQQRIFYSPIFVKTLLFVVIAFWIARNIPVYPFSVLAPHS